MENGEDCNPEGQTVGQYASAYSRLLQDDALKYFPWKRGVFDSEPNSNLNQSSHLHQKVHIDKLILNKKHSLVPQSWQ